VGTESVNNTYEGYRNSKGVNTGPKVDATYNAVIENDVETGIKFEDFFDLMLMQLQNQDFMNPVDDTQYLTQLAQIASMKAMEEIQYYSKANYVMSYMGQEVTAAKSELGGKVSTERGIVSEISLVDGEYTFSVNGKQFDLKEIMLVHDGNAVDKAAEKSVQDATMSNLAMSYLNKVVEARRKDEDGRTVAIEHGVVTEVTQKDGEYIFKINGKEFKLTELTTLFSE
jgi:flagellar hook assembly protein FlgD